MVGERRAHGCEVPSPALAGEGGARRVSDGRVRILMLCLDPPPHPDPLPRSGGEGVEVRVAAERTSKPAIADRIEPPSTPRRSAAPWDASSQASEPMKRLMVKPIPARIETP